MFSVLCSSRENMGICSVVSIFVGLFQIFPLFKSCSPYACKTNHRTKSADGQKRTDVASHFSATGLHLLGHPRGHEADPDTIVVSFDNKIGLGRG